MLAVLASTPRFGIVIVDGYVWLAGGTPGLGAHLHGALGVPMIGVAKTRYASAAGAAEVCRGESRSPLFVSAVGLELAEAVEGVRRMHGPYRVPTLLKQVDALTRSPEQSAQLTKSHPPDCRC